MILQKKQQRTLPDRKMQKLILKKEAEKKLTKT